MVVDGDHIRKSVFGDRDAEEAIEENPRGLNSSFCTIR